MKLTKALAISFVLGFGSLTGCGGTEVAEPAGEDLQQIKSPLACTDFGYTPVSAGLSCISGTFVFNHYFPDGTGCYLANCSAGGAWSYKRISINGAGCTYVESDLCS